MLARPQIRRYHPEWVEQQLADRLTSRTHFADFHRRNQPFLPQRSNRPVPYVMIGAAKKLNVEF